MAISIDTSQDLPLSLVGTLRGILVPLGAVPVWSVDNTSVATIAPADSAGSSALLTSVAPGVVTVMAVLGALSATLDVTVTAGAPDAIEIVPASPITK